MSRIRGDAKSRARDDYDRAGCEHLRIYSGVEEDEFVSNQRFFAQELTRYHALCPAECPIWQANFYDFNVESEKKYLEKIEYMHNNPAVAGLVSTFIEWKWSSARFYELREDVGVRIELGY